MTDLPEDRAKPSAKRPVSRSSRERLREARLEDLESAMEAGKRMCSRIDEAVGELRTVLRLATELEHTGAKGPRDGGSFSQDLGSAIRGLSAVRDRAFQELRDAESREDAHMEAHRRVCAGMDAAVSRVRAALEAAVVLDRASASGFNVEARLNRRLGVRDVVRTVHATHILLSRSVRTSRAKASSNGRILTDLVDDVGPAFE